MRKVLVIDPECRTARDHYGTVTDFLTRSLGAAKKFAVVNRKADEDLGLAPDVAVHRWHDDRTLAGRMFPKIRRSESYQAARRERNAAAIAKLVRQMGLGPGDMLVVPSASASLAHALALAVLKCDPATWPRTHIRLLGIGFTGDATRDAPAQLALAQAAQRFANLRVYCETAEMAATLKRTYPYPDVGEWLMPMVIGASMPPAEKSDPAREFVVGFLGGKRPEQGAAQVPAILRHLAQRLERPENEGVRIRILYQQAGGKAVERLDAAHRAAFEEVRTAGRWNARMAVELLDAGIDNDAFRETIGRTHVLVLPYRVEDYAERGSGLITECGLSGTPVIVTRGLAMGNWRALAGSPTATGPAEFADVILSVAGDYPRFREGALRVGEAMRALIAQRIEALGSGAA